MAEMTMKEALKLVFQTANNAADMLRDSGLVAAHDHIKQAAEMIRDGGPVVEKTLNLSECGGH